MTSRLFVGITEEVESVTRALLVTLTPIIVLVFLAALVSANFIGIFVCIGFEAVLIYACRSKGIAIDFEKKQYQKYTSILGIRRGEWHPLPEFTNIVLFQRVRKVVQQTNRAWGKITYKESFYRVTLHNPQTDAVLMVVNISDEQQARDQANLLSKNLDLPLEIDESMT